MSRLPDLSDSFFDQWVAMCRRLGIDPLDVARVAFAETGMYQVHPNKKAGIWPFITSTLNRMGWQGTALEFFEQNSPEEQLPWIERYLQPYARYLTNDGLVYVATFLPARLPAASQAGDDYVLTYAGEGHGFYENNQILDRDGDGSITTGDLRTWLLHQDKGSRWDAIEAELRDRGASGSGGGGGLLASSRSRNLLLLAAAGGTLYWMYRTASGARIRRRIERLI